MTDLTPIKQEVDEFLYNFQDVKITSLEEYTNAGDLVKQIQNKVKKLEAKRMEYTKPLDESKRLIMADFKAISDPLEIFVKEVKDKMIEWNKLDQKRKDEEQARIEAQALEQAKAENKSEVTVPVLNEQVKTQRGEVSTQTIRKIWKWKIVDETKVPREFLCINSPAVVDAIRNGARKIDGLEIYQEDSLSIR